MININPKNYISENIVSEEKLLEIIEKLKKRGKKIGLCTGSFDLLHPGHITHFVSAKKMCDVLVVAIARDNFSSKKKLGKGCPVYSHDLRAFMVSKLKPVDFVTFDNGSTEITDLIKPHFVIKGIDYLDEKNPGIIFQKKKLMQYGGKMLYTKTEKLSTTDIIKYIKEEID